MNKTFSETFVLKILNLCLSSFSLTIVYLLNTDIRIKDNLKAFTYISDSFSHTNKWYD